VRVSSNGHKGSEEIYKENSYRMMKEQWMVLERMEAHDQGVIAGAERLGDLGRHITNLRQFIMGAFGIL
jgi:hypothetical protein